MTHPARVVLFLVLYQCLSGCSTGEHAAGANDSSYYRRTRDTYDHLGRGMNMLRLGKRDNSFSPLYLHGDPVQARIHRSVDKLEEPVISESHLQTIRKLQENGGVVQDAIDSEMLWHLPRDTNINYMPLRNNNELNKRQLPMLRLGKRLEFQETKDAIRQDNGYFQDFDSDNDGNVRLASYSEDEDEKRDLSMLRLVKRQLPMLRLGKRELPMLRLGKRLNDEDSEQNKWSIGMFRLSKTKPGLIRFGKLFQDHEGKRSLAMLKLGKRYDVLDIRQPQ